MSVMSAVAAPFLDRACAPNAAFSAFLDNAGDRLACLPGRLTLCSREAGWSALLLRRYREPACADHFETVAVPAQSLILVKAGATTIQSLAGGRWRTARYAAGDLGMTPSGETARLRWEGRQQHETVQLHLPDEWLERAAAELGRPGRGSGLNALSARDGLIAEAMLAIERGAEAGYAALYAESAAHFLALHLTGTSAEQDRVQHGDATKMRRLEEYWRAHLADPVSLSDMAGLLGCGTFQLIRLTKRTRGDTPMRLLTNMRLDAAERLLRDESMTERQVALACGYANPAHFANAFRRRFGATPKRFRPGG
jgi:AraC family transcriptional regulator